MEEKGILVTQEGYDKLEKELDYLRTEKRRRRSIQQAHQPIPGEKGIR